MHLQRHSNQTGSQGTRELRGSSQLIMLGVAVRQEVFCLSYQFIVICSTPMLTEWFIVTCSTPMLTEWLGGKLYCRWVRRVADLEKAENMLVVYNHNLSTAEGNHSKVSILFIDEGLGVPWHGMFHLFTTLHWHQLLASHGNRTQVPGIFEIIYLSTTASPVFWIWTQGSHIFFPFLILSPKTIHR